MIESVGPMIAQPLGEPAFRDDLSTRGPTIEPPHEQAEDEHRQAAESGEDHG